MGKNLIIVPAFNNKENLPLFMALQQISLSTGTTIVHNRWQIHYDKYNNKIYKD